MSVIPDFYLCITFLYFYNSFLFLLLFKFLWDSTTVLKTILFLKWKIKWREKNDNRKFFSFKIKYISKYFPKISIFQDCRSKIDKFSSESLKFICTDLRFLFGRALSGQVWNEAKIFDMQCQKKIAGIQIVYQSKSSTHS